MGGPTIYRGVAGYSMCVCICRTYHTYLIEKLSGFLHILFTKQEFNQVHTAHTRLIIRRLSIYKEGCKFYLEDKLSLLQVYIYTVNTYILLHVHVRGIDVSP